MYYMYKDDPWGNKIPVMVISGKRNADAFLERNKGVITKIVRVPRNVQMLIKM